MSHRKVIVVGVDGSAASKSALRWAIAQGDNTVEAVVAAVREPAFVPATSLGVYPYAYKPEAERRRPADRQLHDVVTEVTAGVPGAPEVAEIVVASDPTVALVQASRRADLLVLGAKGHNRIADVFPGSVTAHCVRHAACPVVVIPPAAVD
ncbi:universal stress protein [Umezawaea sp.]|uniref:universal stress protein n=1 Tax=Umezawaea sp. TaxID=1955258 RepID=UPI002ED6A5F3